LAKKTVSAGAAKDIGDILLSNMLQTVGSINRTVCMRIDLHEITGISQTDRGDQKAGTTRKLERPKRWNNRKAGKIRLTGLFAKTLVHGFLLISLRG
jgi:hypothetical protein